MRKLIVLLALISGCSAIRPPCPTGWEVTGTPARGADIVVQVAKERAPCALKWSGRIAWREEPWKFGNALAAGESNPGSCFLDVKVLRLEPAPRSALSQEIAHWLWVWCFDRPGEKATADGHMVPDADLLQWIEGVNTEATRRLMEIAP